jgi:pimeloyl-ACP methyl ester carboxylesterase
MTIRSNHCFGGRLHVLPILFAAALLIGSCTGDAVSPLKTNRPPDPGTLSGSVLTEAGDPVPGARVEVTSERTTELHQALSDAAGQFVIERLPAGHYSVIVTPPSGYEGLTTAAAVVTLRPDQGADVALKVRAITAGTIEVQPGTTDTLALASGFRVAVTASTGAAVRLEAALDDTAPFEDFDVLGIPVRVEIAGTANAAAAARGSFMDSAADSELSVTVWQIVPTCSGFSAEFAFEVGTYGAGDPLFLYSEPSCTTYVDGATGVTGSALASSITASLGAKASIAAFGTDSECTRNERALYSYPGTTENTSLTPLILIHGWQPRWKSCARFRSWEPGEATFSALASAIRSDPVLADRYQLYVLRYPTFEPVANASSFLRDEVQRRGWSNREIVLVGHSMGGLVGRGYIAAEGAEYVRALITLGTPHLGSPVADFSASEDAGRTCVGRFMWGGVKYVLSSRGLSDLDPSGSWIRFLSDKTGAGPRIYTFAGQVGTLEGGDLEQTQCVLEQMGAGPNDGVVPVSSATPGWTTLQTTLAGHDHNRITAGDVVPRVRHTLRTLSQCRPGPVPVPPGGNQFPLSGTLARHEDGRIDVLLNPIVVDGEPIRGLTASNFTIVENHCVQDFDITTDEGNIGVDLVFIQDLSGSMGSAITGVRNSVLSFAGDLAERGLNVRIGSVGYSGPGTIVTHPGSGTCERIGPVHALSTPAAFQTHVEIFWHATGGCDAPENGLEAIAYAHANMEWRAGATRVYILITDISIHTAATNCNGLGRCTDHTLASILELIGETSTLHAVAPSSEFTRTFGGGLDPWLLAEGTGGAKLVLPSGGSVNLSTLGIADKIADVVRLTFTSTSPAVAMHRFRIRVEVGGKVAELSPGLVRYDLHPSLQRDP